MSVEILLHIEGEEPYLCELDEMPNQADQTVIIHNPRRKDGKAVSYLADGVDTVIFPMHRINFIQVLPSASTDEVIGFVRE